MDSLGYRGRAESGLHLLARLSSRPSLAGLDEVLFPEGLNAKDVIDIVGDLASGKTLLCTQLLAKCLLPQKWNSVTIGGLGVGCVIIDTDHHFQLLKLVNMMEQKLVQLKFDGTGKVQLNSKTIEEIIKEALQNLIILKCFSSSQLLTTFHLIPKLLSSNTNVSLILIDSISAYYWEDTMMGGIRKMDLYVKRIVEALQKCIIKYKVTIGYTRPTSFQSKVRNSRDIVGTYTVALKRREVKGQTDIFSVEVKYADSVKKFAGYGIDCNGLHWK